MDKVKNIALFTACRVGSKAKNCRNTTHKMAKSNNSIQGCQMAIE